MGVGRRKGKGGGGGEEPAGFDLELIETSHCCCRYVDPVMATGWHMLLGGLPLAALSLAREGSELGPRLQQLTGQQLSLSSCQLDVALQIHTIICACIHVYVRNIAHGEQAA